MGEQSFFASSDFFRDKRDKRNISAFTDKIWDAILEAGSTVTWAAN